MEQFNNTNDPKIKLLQFAAMLLPEIYTFSNKKVIGINSEFCPVQIIFIPTNNIYGFGISWLFGAMPVLSDNKILPLEQKIVNIDSDEDLNSVEIDEELTNILISKQNLIANSGDLFYQSLYLLVELVVQQNYYSQFIKLQK